MNAALGYGFHGSPLTLLYECSVGQVSGWFVPCRKRVKVSESNEGGNKSLLRCAKFQA
jgi:hypothetical protein